MLGYYPKYSHLEGKNGLFRGVTPPYLLLKHQKIILDLLVIRCSTRVYLIPEIGIVA